MTYLERLETEERSKLKIIRLSIRDYIDEAKKEFTKTISNLDLKQAALVIENRIFASTCDIDGDYECGLEFKNCYFLNTVFFHDAIFSNSVSFTQCFCENELRIHDGVDFQKDFNLVELSVREQIYIDGGNYNDCKWSIIDNGIVKINGGKYENLNLGYWGGGVKLKELHFFFPKVEGNIKITGHKSTIETLSLFQAPKELSLAIEDISVNNLSIYRFRNDHFFRIFNLKSLQGSKPTELSISESFLGKAEFYSIDLSSFQNVYILDAHLTDCFFVNITWKYGIKSFKGRGIAKSKEEEETINKVTLLEKDGANDLIDENLLKRDPSVLTYYSKNREVFRQLKFAAGKQGDVINEQKFHSQEMLAYDRSILLDSDPWTKVIIKFSYWFSDFGQSFIRPIIWLFIIHWILFVFLLWINGYSDLHLTLVNPTTNAFEVALERYFELINPLRKSDGDLKGYKLIIVDLLMRIWSSYMIYNIIRATRRFIK